jgi:hypothetical protein
MKKSTKVWLGIATIWPICWMFIFMGLMLTFVFTLPQGPPPPGQGAPPIVYIFPFMFAMHFLTIIGHLALMVYFIFNIFKNERLEQNYKIMWTILLFFAGMLVMPVYWFLYIWRDAPAAATPAQAGPVYLNQAGTENWTNRAATYEQRPEDEYVRQPPNWRE